VGSSKTSKRWLWTIALVCATILVAAAFWPVNSIVGAYLNSQPQVPGHGFLVFTNGQVYGCVDNSPITPEVVNLGVYHFRPGTGWVWSLRGTDRQILCKPRLLWIRFEAIDNIGRPAVEPFDWRDPFFWKVNRTLRTKKFREVLEE